MNISKEERSRNMRYKKPALMDLSYFAISEKLDEITGICGDIHWTDEDDKKLLNAMDGDEEEVWEIKTIFSSLESEACQLNDQLYDAFRSGYDIDTDEERTFNDLTVALIGNRYQAVGYDDFQEDYYALTSYESELAMTEAGKRVMRMTKSEMLSKIGQVLGIILAFQNVEMKYEYLKSTIDLLMDTNTAMHNQIKAIEAAYEEANEEGFWLYGYEQHGEKVKHFERLIAELPDKVWVE